MNRPTEEFQGGPEEVRQKTLKERREAPEELQNSKKVKVSSSALLGHNTLDILDFCFDF